MSKGSERPSIVPPTPEEDAAITAAALSDPQAQPLTASQVAEMVPLRSLRGRPNSKSKKVLVSVREIETAIAQAYSGKADSLLEDVQGLLGEQSWPND